jgi:hypothetical protein
VNRRRWTEAEFDVLRQLYADTPTAQIAQTLGRDIRHVYSMANRMGLFKSHTFLQTTASGRIMRAGNRGSEHHFKPGTEPWNKGQKGVTGTHPGTVACHFKPGHRPHTWKPIGTQRITDDGYLQTKVTDTSYPPRDWVATHRLVWEAANGPVPPGHLVVFKPGCKTTVPDEITVDKLDCITRRENMHRNSLHRMPKELAELVQLRGVLTRAINTRSKKEPTHE